MHLIRNYLVLSAFLLSSSFAWSANYCVSDSAEFQTALDAAALDGVEDVIQVVQGTYTGTFLYDTKRVAALTIEGGHVSGCSGPRAGYPANTILDGEGSNRPLALVSSTITRFTVDGLSLQNGAATTTVSGLNGGGLYIETYADTSLLNNEFLNNRASKNGGGSYIATETGSILVQNNQYKGNTSEGGGGLHVLADGATLNIDDNIIEGNRAKWGGAMTITNPAGLISIQGNKIRNNSASSAPGGISISSNDGTVLIDGNVISENTFVHSGGGVRVSVGTGSIEMVDNTISGHNSLRGSGAGVYLEVTSGTIALSGNEILNNRAPYRSSYGVGSKGGGVLLSSSGGSHVEVFSNNFSGNYSSSSGGGIYMSGAGSAVFKNNTFSNNTSDRDSGGSIYSNGYELNLVNNSIAGNNGEGSYNSALYVQIPTGVNVQLHNNIIWDSERLDIQIVESTTSNITLLNNDFDQSAAGFNTSNPITIDPSNLDNVNPLFFDTGLLPGDDWDLHISEGSPVINMGTNAAPNLPTTDKDGNPRIIDSTVDMGAYEFAGHLDLADIGLTKVASATEVQPGGLVTYTLAVSNAGSSSATGVQVVDTLPVGATYQSASGHGWSCHESVSIVTCDFTLPVGMGSVTPNLFIEILAANSEQVMTNVAEVRSDQFDPHLGDNTAEADVAIVGLPHITTMLPDHGSTEGGGTLFLSGSNYGSTIGTVSVGTGVCAILSWTNTDIQCELPEGEGTGVDVQVVSAGGKSSNILAFDYDAPVIASISSTSGSTAGGSALIVLGENFGLTPVVQVNGIVCPQTFTSHTIIVCILPEGTGAVNPVELTVGGQTSNALNFAYDAPVLNSVSPDSAPAAGGSTLTLEGENFGASGATVSIAGVACPVQSTTHTQVQCILPAGTGTGLPVIVTQDAQSSTELVTFSYTSTVTVVLTAILPDHGPTAGGTKLNLSGSGFGKAVGTVSVGGKDCTTPVWADVSIECTLPAGEGTGLSVQVVTAAQVGSNTVPFNYDAPVLTSLSPANGPSAGGTLMTLAGKNFGLTPVVKVNGVLCPQTSTDHTQIICIVPAGSGAVNPVGITVAGQTSNTLNFVYDSPPLAPVLTSVTPDVAPAAGGTTLTLDGSNFGASGATVTVGGVNCPVTSQSTGQIQCTLAAGTGKDLSVVVTQGGQSSTESVTFSYTHTVEVTIDGKGKVISSPDGIDCGTDCNEEFISTAGISLTATADLDWAFESWGGDCAGSGSTACNLTIDSNKDVQADFSCVFLSVPAIPSIITSETFVCVDIEAKDGVEIMTDKGDVTFRAENSITLGPEFRVGADAQFRAVIE